MRYKGLSRESKNMAKKKTKKSSSREIRLMSVDPVSVYYRKDGTLHVFSIVAPAASSGIPVIKDQAVSASFNTAKEDAIEAFEQELLEYYGETQTEKHVQRLEKAMYKKRKLSRNKPMAKRNAKKKAKKKAKKRTTSRPKGFGTSRQRSRVGRAAPGMKRRGITYRPAGFGTAGKKKSTKKKAKKKTAKRKTTKRKTTKRRTTKKTQGRCLTAAQAKQMRKQIAALQKTLSSMKTAGSPKAKSAKAKAAAQLRKVRKAYITAAACRLGVQRAKSAGQTVRAKCKKPPSRVTKSAKVLGRQRAQKSGEKRYTTKQLMRNFLDPKQDLIK